jgi:hypothetical protein
MQSDFGSLAPGVNNWQVRALERMVSKEQAIAVGATAAATSAAAAAEREATRNRVHDMQAGIDDSDDFNRDLEDGIGSKAPAARLACRQTAIAMRVAAHEDAHSLALLSDEMKEDQQEVRARERSIDQPGWPTER